MSLNRTSGQSKIDITPKDLDIDSPDQDFDKELDKVENEIFNE